MKTLITLALLMCVLQGCGPAGPGEQQTSHAADDATSDAHEDADEHGDDGEDEGHEEGHVELSAQQVEAAGIRVATTQSGRIETVLTFSATVSASLDAQAHINPRVGGLVRAIHASLGQSIQKGDPLCEIDSVDLGRAVSAFLGAKATVETSESTLARERELLTHNLELANEIFEREKDLAEREITTLSARYAAEQALQDAQLRLDSRMLEIEARLARERIELSAAHRELDILGLEAADLTKIVASGDEPHIPFGTYTIRAPRDGIIVDRDVTENEFVDPKMTLFNLQDLSRVWVLASIYEQDLISMKIGATASVHLDAFPDVEFRGEVGFIDYRIDRTTRAASLRIELDNGPIDAWDEPWPIRPGMFGVVEITTGVLDAAVAIPESALVHEDEGEFVFVTHEPGTFERRAVRLGTSGHDNVEIVDGLEPGESIVIAGTFALKSASRAGELGEGHSH
jgi:cobalt-zinc-cadmium efflux system membrane fusion protein